MGTLTLRRLSAFSFVLCYVFIGIPLWYHLTTIYRAPLPKEYIEDLNENLHSDIHMVIPVYVKSDTYRFPDMCDAIQLQINAFLSTSNENGGKVDWSIQIVPYEEGKVNSEEDYVVTLVLDEFSGLTIPYLTKETIVFFNDEAVVSNDLPFFVAQALIEHTFQLEWEHLSNPAVNAKQTGSRDMAIGYDPDVHMSISLLTGDGYPVSWDIDKALQRYFTPLRELLSPLVNFTVDTGIEYFNDLNLHSLENVESVSWNDLSHTLDLSDISSMNHYSEQTALNLAIVFPSMETGALEFINDTRKDDEWRSFLVPQWGVIVVNKHPLPMNAHITEEYLAKVLYRFSNEIFRLLGLTDSSQELQTPLITINSFKRLVTIQNLEKSIDTLWSLVKMTNHLQQMSIPKEVLEDVNNALELRLEIVELLNDPALGDDATWNTALRLSNKLVKICERAFFHKEMVQQTFFPQEHKIAVYLPLLGPITVVTFTGFIKTIKEMSSRSRKKEEKEDKED